MRRRRFLALLALAPLAAVAGGCNHWAGRPGATEDNHGPIKANAEPKAADLVAYLNDNSRKVSGLFCKNVVIDAKQGTQMPIGMDGVLACDKSRNFRMKAKVAGNEVADFGSNQEEFWYWITKAEPPYVYHGKYADMKNAPVQLPIPFQPDIVIAALGIGDYDPNGKYEVRTSKDYVELLEPSVSIQGKPIWKVTVFNRGSVTASKPQVVAYRLIDDKGKDIAVATITGTELHRESGAVLPKSMVLTLIPEKTPNEKVEMKMVFQNMQVRTFDNDMRNTMFSLGDALTASRQGYDMARGAVDGAPGGIGTGPPIQRTNANTLPNGR